jgi:hypothetical protein
VVQQSWVDQQMQKEIILHIGLQKTGTTSFQTFMEEQLEQLHAQNTDVIPGLYIKGHHFELALASIRDDVEIPPLKNYLIHDVHKYRLDLKNRIKEFICKCKYDRIIFSSEALSLLRTVAECQELRKLFPEDIVRFTIVLVIRPKDEFLNSLRKQVRRSEHGASSNPNSAFYVEDDTWVTDFETLIDAYRKVFGKVSVLSYKKDGVLKLILDEIGLNFGSVDKLYKKNKTPKNIYIWKIRGKVNRFLKWICVKIGLREKV